MIRVGAGYLFEKAVMDGYALQGMEYIESDLFWNEHAIGTKQFKYDIKFLYGILQSATKTRLNPYLIHHCNDKDGLAVWIKFDKTYANGRSKNMGSEELEEQIYLHYNPREHKGIAEYVDKFQTWMEELDALGTRHYKDADKKWTLLRKLETESRLLSLIQIWQDDLLKNFEETANYLRENGTSLDRTLQ